ncbi:hypothetical protein [Bergeriella denitrificans]|uniref:Phage associated protein n=1 Tax=Bergeriella denitrificans TaxID=494 RepID=A0A378UIX9_BERDE|nr:hypothetical protein [Bergeriella denitrificans]STZ77344.1 phage associated protein [Bergeriella denitrificans]
MIAHVCAATGWTWDYVAEHIDLPRLKHLGNYWKQHPPVHLLVAGYMGYKGGNTADEPIGEDEAVALLGGGHELSESEFEDLLKAKGLI